MLALAGIRSVADWSRVFARLDLWAPLARLAMESHDLRPPDTLRMAPPGTHAVLCAGGELAVKFYAPFWPEDWGKDVELYGFLGKFPELMTPRLVACGSLPQDAPGAGGHSWPYTITTWLPGQPIGDVWSSLDRGSRLSLAANLGKLLLRLHAVPPDGLESVSTAPEDWVGFLSRQAAGAAQRYFVWGSLPGRLVDELGSYLAHERARPRPSWRPVLLNCDVTDEHVLVARRRGHGGERWEITGLVDFGDAMCGEPEYEFTAVALSALSCDREAVGVLLEAYGFHPPCGIALPDRLLAYALMHCFDVMVGLPECGRRALLEARSLTDFARILW